MPGRCFQSRAEFIENNTSDEMETYASLYIVYVFDFEVYTCN